MASDKPFNYHSGLWMLLSCIILGLTCSRIQNDSIEDSAVDNRLEKIHFADLVMQSQLQGFLLPANFKSDGMTSHEKTKTVSFLE